MEHSTEAVSACDRPFSITFLPISMVMTNAQYQEQVSRMTIDRAKFCCYGTINGWMWDILQLEPYA